MKELLDILKESRHLAEKNQTYALATVVKIGGSTYRRPGARMLISADGEHWGTISGGCLEGEVAAQAMQVIEEGQARLIPFDLEDDDIVLGFGAGCNGIVHVLVQPILPEDRSTPIDALNLCIRERRNGVLATIVADEREVADSVGKQLLFMEAGPATPTTVQHEIADLIIERSRQLLEKELTEPQMYGWHSELIQIAGRSVDVLFEIVRPPVRLFIFGEGHDVRAMVDQANLLGWRVVIVGRKPIDVLQRRFPSAEDWKFLMHPEQTLKIIATDPRSAALVMNHSYVRDKRVMQELLQSNIPFIGMLGPRERISAMIDELGSEGRVLNPEDLRRVFGPVGLDIGTETPEEIALAAVSEIQSVLHDRNGGPLRDRQGPIHTERNPIESFY